MLDLFHASPAVKRSQQLILYGRSSTLLIINACLCAGLLSFTKVSQLDQWLLDMQRQVIQCGIYCLLTVFLWKTTPSIIERVDATLKY